MSQVSTSNVNGEALICVLLKWWMRRDSFELCISISLLFDVLNMIQKLCFVYIIHVFEYKYFLYYVKCTNGKCTEHIQSSRLYFCLQNFFGKNHHPEQLIKMAAFPTARIIASHLSHLVLGANIVPDHLRRFNEQSLEISRVLFRSLRA